MGVEREGQEKIVTILLDDDGEETTECSPSCRFLDIGGKRCTLFQTDLVYTQEDHSSTRYATQFFRCLPCRDRARVLEPILPPGPEEGPPEPDFFELYHAASGYISRLISKGYKVAICDQVEDPKDLEGDFPDGKRWATVLYDELKGKKTNWCSPRCDHFRSDIHFCILFQEPLRRTEDDLRLPGGKPVYQRGEGCRNNLPERAEKKRTVEGEGKGLSVNIPPETVEEIRQLDQTAEQIVSDIRENPVEESPAPPASAAVVPETHYINFRIEELLRGLMDCLVTSSAGPRDSWIPSSFFRDPDLRETVHEWVEELDRRVWDLEHLLNEMEGGEEKS